MKLILLRHGETEWSVTGQHTGRTDIPLTDKGRSQAAASSAVVRGMLEGEAEPLVYSSPLQRAVETARIALPEFEMFLRDELLEVDYGECEGLTPKEIRDRIPGWDLWRDGCPSGESVEDAGARVDQFLAEIEDELRPVIAVAHGHLLRILATRAVGLEPAQGQIFTLDTATVSCVADVRGKRVIKHWNVR